MKLSQIKLTLDNFMARYNRKFVQYEIGGGLGMKLSIRIFACQMQDPVFLP